MIKELFKCSKPLFILVVINLLIFIFLFKDIILFDSIREIFYYSFKALIPFLSFLVLLLHDYKYGKNLFVGLLSGFLIFFFFIYIIILSFELCNIEITNINKYKLIKNRYSIKYLPRSIPKDSKMKASDYIFELYYKTDDDEIKNIKKKLNKDNLWHGKLTNEVKNEYCVYNTGYDVYKNNDKDFETYIIKGKGYRESFYPNHCNHGESYIISINDKTNEIIYVYEYVM